MAFGSADDESTVRVREVVVPLDGSPFGERAIPTALAFASAFDAALVLVHGTTEDDSIDDGYLTQVAASIRSVDVSTAVERDTTTAPWSQRPTGGDELLVCLATHGHGGVVGVHLGGFADRLLGEVDATFVLLGPEVDPLEGARFAAGHLVLCFDGSDHARSMVTWAVNLARTFDADIKVAMVLHRHGEFLGAHDATRPRQAAAALVDELAEQGLAAELVLLDGLEPGRVIAEYAAQLPAALIVTSTHGSQGMVRSLIGSTAIRVVRHAPCPVVMRRPD